MKRHILFSILLTTSVSIFADFAILPDFEQGMRPPGDSVQERSTSLNNFTNGFNLPLFMKDVKATKAKELIWMTGHQRWGYLFSQNAYYEKILPGWSAKRNLPKELAAECKKNGIAFLLAIPASMGPTQFQPGEVPQAFQWNESNLEQYRKHYEEFVYSFLESCGKDLSGVVFMGSFPKNYQWLEELASLCRSVNPKMRIVMELPENSKVPRGVISARTLLKNEVERFQCPEMERAFLVPFQTNPKFNATPYDYPVRTLRGLLVQAEPSKSHVIFVIPVARRGKLLPSVVERLGTL